jgi:hypothetical protein
MLSGIVEANNGFHGTSEQNRAKALRPEWRPGFKMNNANTQ